MDQLLSKAGSTLVTFAVRSGVQVASTYVIKSVGNLMDHVPEHERKKLERKKDQLQDKIETVTYTIEVIQLMAARGNSNLESVLKLTTYLKEDIDEFSDDINLITSVAANKKLNTETLKLIDKKIDSLVDKIDSIIPVLNLVLTTYGTANVQNFQNYVSPGRLLNATVIINKTNQQFDSLGENTEVKIGPEFSLTFYNIFYNANSESKINWREKYAKCKFQVFRVPKRELKYHYELRITEDFNDDRYHEEDEKSEMKVFDIQQVSKLFFSASGRLLKLGDRSSPVLVLKMKKVTSDDESTNSDESFEWIAVGDYESNESDSESEEEEVEEEKDADDDGDEKNTDVTRIENKAIDPAKLQSNTTKISLLEYILRLCTLQANDQISILEVKDERLRTYLSDENHLDNMTQKITVLSKKMETLKIQ